MIRHMRHGSPPRLMALQSILSPNRRESLPTPSAGVRMTRSAGPDRPDAYFIPSSKKASPSGAAITDEVRSAAPISVLIITLPCLLCWFLSVVSGSAFRSQDHGTKCRAREFEYFYKKQAERVSKKCCPEL